MQGLVIPPGGGVASATNLCDVQDIQGAHGAEQPMQRSEADFVRPRAGDGRAMEHERGPADAPALGNYDNVRQDGEARPQACGETSPNSFVHETHAVPQPLAPEDVFASLIYEIKSASERNGKLRWNFSLRKFIIRYRPNGNDSRHRRLGTPR